MGNGVSGKASANLKTIYLDVEGRKHKVIGKFQVSSNWASFCGSVCFLFSVAQHFQFSPFNRFNCVKLTILILLSTTDMFNDAN